MQELYYETVLSVPNRALATAGPAGLNVVPVSVVTQDGDDIILYDFFMEKTAANIKATGTVSLAVWEGLVGIQLKGLAVYDSESAFYHEAVSAMQERFPERTLHGIIRCTFTEVYSISAGSEAGQKLN